MPTPVEKVGKTADGHITWKYLCECGNFFVASKSRVSNGYTRSCGCLVGRNNKTHGMRRTPTYSSWSSAKDRATNHLSKDFHRYGAVGIGMDERWLTFENFLEDMGERPSKNHSIDRIDPQKGYEPGNCRWATAKEQARNMRDVVRVDVGGVIVDLVDYAEQIGITTGAAHLRLKRGKLQGAKRV